MGNWSADCQVQEISAEGMWKSSYGPAGQPGMIQAPSPVKSQQRLPPPLHLIA